MTWGTNAHLLEIGTSSEDLVDEILDTQDVVFAQCRFDNAVVGEWDSLLVHLAIPAFVDQLTDRLEIGFPVSEQVRINKRVRV